MSINELILSLSGDLYADPALIVETIGEDDDLKAAFRETVRGGKSYESFRELMGEYI